MREGLERGLAVIVADAGGAVAAEGEAAEMQEGGSA